MSNIKDSFKAAGIVALVIVAAVILLASYKGCRLASDAISMDPAVNRQKRIEKKVDEVDIKFDQLIDLAKRWE